MTQRTTLAAFRRSIPVLALSLALFACSNEDSNKDNEKIEGKSLLLNFTSDYTTGELRWMHPDSARLSNGALSFNQNSYVSSAEGNIFILENNPGTLSCILPQSIGDESKIKQERLNAEFPYEVAVIGNKGYIALNDADYVQVFDISTCTLGEKIDLPISGAGASTIKASGDTLLLTLQRLENWVPTELGLLVRINAKANALIDTIQLKLYNPSSSVLNNGKLYVSFTGPYSEDYSSVDKTKAGIEVVDLAVGTSEVLVTGTQLEGGAGDIALDEINKVLYASVYADWINFVKPVNLTTKTVGNTLPDIINVSGGLVFDKAGKKLFIGDKADLKVYDTVTKKTKTIGGQDLPPYSLAIVNF